MNKLFKSRIYSLISASRKILSSNKQINSISDCVYLASFPKSGNTWVRFMFANLFNEIDFQFPEIDFHNIHEIIPELGTTLKFKFINLPKIIKTHQEYNKDFNRVILILRNPWDLLYSYYKYINGEKKDNISLTEIIMHNTYGIRAMVKHVNSYIYNCHNLIIVTYEQLHSDQYRFFKKLCKSIGLICDNSKIINAVNKSSFESMCAVEYKKGRKYGGKDYSFIRAGKVGEGFSKISLKDRDFISKEITNSPIINLMYG